MDHNLTNQATSIATIPPGFTIGTAPDGTQYLVPSHMVPALDQAFASYQSKINIGVPNAVGGVSVDIPTVTNFRTLWGAECHMPSATCRVPNAGCHMPGP